MNQIRYSKHIFSTILLVSLLSVTCRAEDIYVNKVWPLGDNQFYVYLVAISV